MHQGRAKRQESALHAATNRPQRRGAGPSGTKWRLKTKRDGVQKVLLKGIRNAPDQFLLRLKAKHFFAAANDTPENTLLTVTIGGRCFTHAATKLVP